MGRNLLEKEKHQLRRANHLLKRIISDALVIGLESVRRSHRKQSQGRREHGRARAVHCFNLAATQVGIKHKGSIVHSLLTAHSERPKRQGLIDTHGFAECSDAMTSTREVSTIDPL